MTVIILICIFFIKPTAVTHPDLISDLDPDSKG